MANTSFLANDLDQLVIDFARHPCCVTANVEIRFLLLKKVVDEGRIFFNPLLDINLFLCVTRESCYEFEGVA